MVTGGTVICKYCNTKFCLKVQVSFSDHNNIRIPCPDCKVVLRGKFKMNNGGELSFENANISGGINLADKIVRVSTEIPIVYTQDDPSNLLTPFMAYYSKNSLEGLQKFGHQYGRFVANRNNSLSDLKDLTDFIENDNFETASKLINSGYKSIDYNTINDVKHLYSYIPDVFGEIMKHVFPKDYETQLYNDKLVKHLVTPLISDNQGIEIVLEKCRELYSLDRDYIASLRLLIKYIENIEPFLPLMVLSNDLGSREEFISNEYQITTFDYSELKEYYIEAFELLSRITILYKGLIAYIDNGDPDIHNGRFGINCLEDYAEKNNGIKKDVIARDTRLHNYFSFLLDNRIRNGIGHVKTKYITERQIIRYYPHKDSAKKDESEEITLTNFAYRSHLMMLAIYDGIRIISELHGIKQSTI